jgi:hypothetical protein
MHAIRAIPALTRARTAGNGLIVAESFYAFAAIGVSAEAEC